MYNQDWKQHEHEDAMAKDLKDLKAEQFKILVQIMGGLMTILIAAGAWWMNNMWQMIAVEQALITKVQLETSLSYVPRAELQQIFSEINRKLDALQRDSTYGRERGVRLDRAN